MLLGLTSLSVDEEAGPPLDRGLAGTIGDPHEEEGTRDGRDPAGGKVPYIIFGFVVKRKIH